MLVPALDQYNMQRLTRPCYKGITMMALQLVTSPIAAPEALDSVPEKSIEPVGVGWRGLAWVGVGWRGGWLCNIVHSQADGACIWRGLACI